VVFQPKIDAPLRALTLVRGVVTVSGPDSTWLQVVIPTTVSKRRSGVRARSLAGSGAMFVRSTSMLSWIRSARFASFGSGLQGGMPRRRGIRRWPEEAMNSSMSRAEDVPEVPREDAASGGPI